MLQQSAGVHDVGGVNWLLLAALGFTWLFIAASLARSMLSIGKVLELFLMLALVALRLSALSNNQVQYGCFYRAQYVHFLRSKRVYTLQY